MTKLNRLNINYISKFENLLKELQLRFKKSIKDP